MGCLPVLGPRQVSDHDTSLIGPEIHRFGISQRKGLPVAASDHNFSVNEHKLLLHGPCDLFLMSAVEGATFDDADSQVLWKGEGYTSKSFYLLIFCAKGKFVCTLVRILVKGRKMTFIKNFAFVPDAAGLGQWEMFTKESPPCAIRASM